MQYKYSLFERMKAWVELFAKREDIVMTDSRDEPVPASKVLTLGDPRDLGTRFPEDARTFAAACDNFVFSYRMRKDVDADPDLVEACTGFLFLTLDGAPDRGTYNTYMVLDDQQVDPDLLSMLDVDAIGTGLAAWYVLDEPSFIIWDLEDCVRFRSLTEYLTEGAKRAFAYNPCWQTLSTRSKEAPLAQRSVSKTTPIPELRERLVRRGAESDMADDLIAWLGTDVALLLPSSPMANSQSSS